MHAATVERPPLGEILGILAICTVLVILLARLDGSAAQRESERATAAMAKLARGSKAGGVPVAAPSTVARTETLGMRGPIVVPTGQAWGPAGTTISHAPDDGATAAAPSNAVALRRILGPSELPRAVARGKSSAKRAVQWPARRREAAPATAGTGGAAAPVDSAPVAAAPAAPVSAAASRASLWLVFMAGFGMFMAGMGLTVLGRAR